MLKILGKYAGQASRGGRRLVSTLVVTLSQIAHMVRHALPTRRRTRKAYRRASDATMGGAVIAGSIAAGKACRRQRHDLRGRFTFTPITERQFDQPRQHKEKRRCSQECTSQETGGVSVGGDPEKLDAPVDCQRRCRQEKPFARRRFGLSQRLDQRVKESARCEACVYSGAPSTNGEGMFVEKKRAFGKLMTEMTEGLVNRSRERLMTGSRSYRRCDDSGDEKKCQRGNHKPHNDGPTIRAGLGNVMRSRRGIHNARTGALCFVFVLGTLTHLPGSNSNKRRQFIQVQSTKKAGLFRNESRYPAHLQYAGCRQI